MSGTDFRSTTPRHETLAISSTISRLTRMHPEAASTSCRWKGRSLHALRQNPPANLRMLLRLTTSPLPVQSRLATTRFPSGSCSPHTWMISTSAKATPPL